jgi:tetraacyldisaccharide 4'-kinase
MKNYLEQHWYVKCNFLLTLLLLPPTLLFACISTTRRLLFKMGILPQYRLGVPVVVIGNISVGGVGKTPLTKYLAQCLTNNQINVGVILRGYKSNNRNATIVNTTDDSQMVGDEALIYARNNIPVAISKNRYQAGRTLLQHYPHLQLILSDDGLQHYWLARDYEIIVVDSSRMFGNKWLLPMGSLREPLSRLKKANAIVINGGQLNATTNFEKRYNIRKNQLIITQTMIFTGLYNPVTQQTVQPEYCNGKRVLLACAMGNPRRLFDFVNQLGIQVTSHLAFPDHHHYKAQDLPSDYDIILVTEKDYTKLAQFNLANLFIVQVTVQLTPNTLINQLNGLVKP